MKALSLSLKSFYFGVSDLSNALKTIYVNRKKVISFLSKNIIIPISIVIFGLFVSYVSALLMHIFM